ncbi:hypothetical protein L7F22_066200 [Adiantum nelumboides]|nr:hypothetical protein [Adiantum nelumboides]
MALSSPLPLVRWKLLRHISAPNSSLQSSGIVAQRRGKKAHVHQNEGANLLVDKLKGQLKDAKVALLKAKDSVNVVDAMHVEELKSTIGKLSLTLQTLQVVVEEKAPLDAMASTLKERDFTQEVEECAQARMDFVEPFTEVKFVGGKKCGDKDSKVLGHAEKEDVLDKEAEPDTKVEIVGGYNCEEQNSKVEVHVEKEGVLEEDSPKNGDQVENCPSMKDNEVSAKDTSPSILQTIQMMQRDRKSTMTDAATSNIHNLDQIISMIAKSTMKDPPDMRTQRLSLRSLNHLRKLVMHLWRQVVMQVVQVVQIGAGGAVGAIGVGGAGEHTDEPPQENGDASVDASGDASCGGGAGGGAIGASAAKYVRHNDGTMPHPWEDGGDARGVVGYVRNTGGTVSLHGRILGTYCLRQDCVKDARFKLIGAKLVFYKKLNDFWEKRAQYNATSTILVDDTQYKQLWNPPCIFYIVKNMENENPTEIQGYLTTAVRSWLMAWICAKDRLKYAQDFVMSGPIDNLSVMVAKRWRLEYYG